MIHPIILIGMALAEAAMRNKSGVKLPAVEGGLSNGMGYKPEDHEEYDYIVDHAMQCGMPVAPPTAEKKTREHDEFPHLIVDRGMLVGAKIVQESEITWMTRDQFFDAISKTGKACTEEASKPKTHEQMFEPESGSRSTASQFGRGSNRDGLQIIVPPGMSKAAAAEELMRQHDADMKEASYTRGFPGYYYKDVAVAVRKAIENTFGWLDSVKTPGGFFSPDAPPVLLDVTVSVNEDGSAVTEKGFFGRAAVSAWGYGSYVETDTSSPFSAGVKAKARKMHEPQIQLFFSEVERVLREESIFKGRAVTIEYRDGDGDDDMENEGIHMEFLHLRTNPNIVLNENTQAIFDVLVEADLRGSSKRIYLLTGSYGNGKTETCLSLGKRAMERGYAFFYVKSPERVAEILVAAKRYLPAVVFLEDVDQIASGERSDAINEILNTLDGTELKGCNIKILFTTNHPDKLNTALRRPGRIDHVIKFENPNTKSRLEIIRRLLGNEPGFDALDLEECESQLPQAEGAFIAEICKRAAQYGRAAGGLTADIFKTTSDSMAGHIELMREEVRTESKVEDAVKTLLSLSK